MEQGEISPDDVLKTDFKKRIAEAIDGRVQRAEEAIAGKFEVNYEQGGLAKGTIINRGGAAVLVELGESEPTHQQLVHLDEEVVNFAGLPDDFVEMTRKLKKDPLIPEEDRKKLTEWIVTEEGVMRKDSRQSLVDEFKSVEEWKDHLASVQQDVAEGRRFTHSKVVRTWGYAHPEDGDPMRVAVTGLKMITEADVAGLIVPTERESEVGGKQSLQFVDNIVGAYVGKDGDVRMVVMDPSEEVIGLKDEEFGGSLTDYIEKEQKRDPDFARSLTQRLARGHSIKVTRNSRWNDVDMELRIFPRRGGSFDKIRGKSTNSDLDDYRGDPGERPNLREIVIKPEELREVKFVLPKEFVGEQV